MEKPASSPATRRAPWFALPALLLIAALAGAPLAVHADAGPKVIKKVPPDFPVEAVRKGITEGVLKAKLSIDGAGAVTEVTIVEAAPPKAKVFSDAATAALTQWKFEASGKPQTVELKLVFAQE